MYLSLKLSIKFSKQQLRLSFCLLMIAWEMRSCVRACLGRTKKEKEPNSVNGVTRFQIIY